MPEFHQYTRKFLDTSTHFQYNNAIFVFFSKCLFHLPRDLRT